MLALVLASAAMSQSRRDGKMDVAPPPVISQTIEMRRGEQVVLPLGIHGTRGELLEFLIRTPPVHGRLSAVKNATLNSATVTYVSSLRGTADQDSFSYAVRSSTGVSAPGVVTIRFVHPVVAAAKLKAPVEMEFPPVFPGQRSTADLELANEGGEMLEGEVAVPEPWSIEGLKIFRLGGGQHATFKLIFTPTQPGVRTGEAIISGTEHKVIPLRASAEERLAATPALLKLTAQPGSQTRMGVLKITNCSEEDATVAVEADARLLTDHTVKVPAKGASTVPVFADAAEVAAFDDAVKLSNKEWKATVPVHAVAVGPILRFSTDEVSITGNAADPIASGVAILENTGGETLTLRLDVGQPFDVETRVVTAPASGRVEIPIFMQNPGPGTFHTSMRAGGEGASAIVQVKAEIAEADETRTTVRASLAARRNRADTKPAETTPKENETLLIPQNVREIPNALGKFAHGTGMNSARLDWPANLGPLENARIEERVLSLSDNSELQIGWSPLANTSITPGAERVTAELRELKPGTFYTVRVVTGKNADTSVLFTSDFWTVAKKPLFTASLRTPMLIVALAALAFAIWRSRRTPVQPVKK